MVYFLPLFFYYEMQLILPAKKKNTSWVSRYDFFTMASEPLMAGRKKFVKASSSLLSAVYSNSFASFFRIYIFFVNFTIECHFEDNEMIPHNPSERERDTFSHCNLSRSNLSTRMTREKRRKNNEKNGFLILTETYMSAWM